MARCYRWCRHLVVCCRSHQSLTVDWRRRHLQLQRWSRPCYRCRTCSDTWRSWRLHLPVWYSSSRFLRFEDTNSSKIAPKYSDLILLYRRHCFNYHRLVPDYFNRHMDHQEPFHSGLWFAAVHRTPKDWHFFSERSNQWIDNWTWRGRSSTTHAASPRNPLVW